MEITLSQLQSEVRNLTLFHSLADYQRVCNRFLDFVAYSQPTRIVSPSHPHYIFYQFGEGFNYRITRPLNSHLYLETKPEFDLAFERFFDFLSGLRQGQETFAAQTQTAKYLESNEINQVVYTLQQSIGCIGDSFSNTNQARKRIGQLFERLIKLIIREVGLNCEPRTIRIPIPDYPDYRMPYELDVVFSRNRAIIASETQYIYPNEIVGSIKTTSKDRIDKIFLDKYLLTQLLGRDIPVVAIFLHDVQRAIRKTVKGRSEFAIASTFKRNHFLGYTVALKKLDGVYYVDPRPEMLANERLREQIYDFQRFLAHDLWMLSG